jgi:type IX secretion system PorP/SprF family membrane protein
MRNNNNKLTLQLVKLLFSIVLVGTILPCYAQLNPLQSIYYQNPYLYNPSYAGMDEVLNINANFRKQWIDIPGSPMSTSLTIDRQVLDRVGLGLNIIDNQAGLIRQTRVMGTYAYHLPLSETQQLHFGLSFGLDDSRININKVIGDISDVEIAAYNVFKPYVDGDFGVAYTNGRLQVGAAIPNLKTVFFKTSDFSFDANRMTFMALAKYKISVVDDFDNFVLEPIGGFRLVKGYNAIADIGFNFFMSEYGIYLQSIYHTSRSLGLGVGLNRDNYMVNFSYNMETGALSNQTRGFELGIKVKVFNGNKRNGYDQFNF